MENNKNIQDKIDSTLSAMDTIESVNVSPFFKDKAMQRLFAEKEEGITVWNWFTPKLQLATLVCVVVLNVFAFSNLKASNTTSYNDNIDEFAETYGLSSTLETSFLN